MLYGRSAGRFYKLQLISHGSSRFTQPELSLGWSDLRQIKSVIQVLVFPYPDLIGLVTFVKVAPQVHLKRIFLLLLHCDPTPEHGISQDRLKTEWPSY